MPITYTIDLHDITELTWPMWDACGIKCPSMIGAPCPGRDDSHYMDGPADARHYRKTCPGWSAKFSHAATEVVYGWTLDSQQSEECGNASDGPAWFALFRNPDASTHDGPMGAGLILTVASGGGTVLTRFGTVEEMEKDWQLLLDEDTVANGDDECENGSPTCTDEDPCVVCHDENDEDDECEGHYDDDHTLTSGAGIGEPTYCDGSCNTRGR